MAKSVLAAQLYTLRDFTKTPTDLAKTLSRVRKIGYEAVQISAIGPMDPKEVARMLKNEGLACCATHTSLERMREQTPAVIEELKLWDCQYVAIGWFNPTEPSARAWSEFARQYSELAKRFAGTGISIGYHNHSHEMARFDGKPALQILLEDFGPSIWMEIDTYWITHGGGDPAAWIGKCKGRIPCVHLKDMAIKPDRTHLIAEVGEGNLNWPAVLKACRDAGVKWYIVEQDVCPGDPIDSLEISFKNLRQMGIH